MKTVAHRNRKSMYDDKELEIIQCAMAGMTLQGILDYVYPEDGCFMCVSSLATFLRKRGIRLLSYKGGGNANDTIQMRMCSKCEFHREYENERGGSRVRICHKKNKAVNNKLVFAPQWCDRRFDVNYKDKEE